MHLVFSCRNLFSSLAIFAILCFVFLPKHRVFFPSCLCLMAQTEKETLCESRQQRRPSSSNIFKVNWSSKLKNFWANTYFYPHIKIFILKYHSKKPLLENMEKEDIWSANDRCDIIRFFFFLLEKLKTEGNNQGSMTFHLSGTKHWSQTSSWNSVMLSVGNDTSP